MALHIAVLPDRIALVAAYEDGRAEVWSCSLEHVGTPWDGRKATSGDDKPWTLLWCGKAHNEAGELRSRGGRLADISHGHGRRPVV